MIEVDIPTIDPIQHEPKLIFGMTLRQALCAIVGGGCGVASYCAMQFLFNIPDMAMLGFLIFALPAVLMGWYRPFNMKAEDYFKLIYYNNFIAYPTRILKTDDADDIKQPTLKERQEMERRLQQDQLKKKKAAAQKNLAAKTAKKGGPK